ncbi:MAG: 16S rRNA (adenine(1518)-N(6)/adenine(1519)-N(6))-dimethyltransferase RsmA [Lentihominibacter sp.]|jgi:16S rRNA (adenine1518-N6/adenine1519-N6)-dimethyltransferase
MNSVDAMTIETHGYRIREETWKPLWKRCLTDRRTSLMELYSPSTIKEISEKYGFRFSRSLGQNFITDRNVLNKIVEGAEIGPEDLVIEIGPGFGALTAELAQVSSRVVAIELDSRLIPILQSTLKEYDNVELVNRDILKADIGTIIDEYRDTGKFTGKARIAGNLPYYITTPIIMKILESEADVDSITVMMQKEVADRIEAEPGSKTYGAISVAVQYYCTVSRVASVARSCFIPPPNVDSAVLNLKIRKEKPAEVKDRKVFFDCIKAGFGQRRKTLLNSLSGAGGTEKERVKEILEAAGIEPGRRAETLSVEEFARIANEMA